MNARGKVDLRSLSVFEVEESYGFVDTPRGNLPLQMRSSRFELPARFPHENGTSSTLSPGASIPLNWDVSGKPLQENHSMKKSENVVHDFHNLSRLKSSKMPQFYEMEDQSRISHVALEDMLRELQNTLHQLKVLHAFPPGTNFEDEHSELVKAILAMTMQLAKLKDSSFFNDTNKEQSFSHQISANDLRELVSRFFNSETMISSHQSKQNPSSLESSLILCTRNNLFCSIRECLTKTRADWSAQYKQLEEQYQKSCQEIKTTRHEAADEIQKATAQYKDAELVWETNHSHLVMTIGNLREQLHNITVRYSNLQMESKSEQDSQGKELRQQISHLQGQVSALKQVAENQTFHHAEETRRYEALCGEHDKLLLTLSMQSQKDERNDALSAENSKLEIMLRQKQTDLDSIANKYSNLQSHFSQQQSSFQQLVSNPSSLSKDTMIELRSQVSELLAEQQRNHDDLAASLRTNNALENENKTLKQILYEKSLEITEKDDEIRQHELFQLECAESDSKRLQHCTSILQEVRHACERAFPGLLQDNHNLNSSKWQHADFCDLIRSDMTIILDRQLTLEKLIPELRSRIKILRTQAKVASSQAMKNTEDRIYEVENIMDHNVDAHVKEKVIAAVDRAKLQLRDLNVAHEHHYVIGTQEIREQLNQDIMRTTIKDRSLRDKLSAIFERREQSSGQRAHK